MNEETQASKPVMYYVDYENVHNEGLEGVRQLDASSQVVIFYSKKAGTINIDQAIDVFSSDAKVQFVKIDNGTPNALDFQLTTMLVASMTPECEYVIVSADTGYDAVIKMARRLDLPAIRRKRSIIAAIDAERAAAESKATSSAKSESAAAAKSESAAAAKTNKPEAEKSEAPVLEVEEEAPAAESGVDQKASSKPDENLSSAAAEQPSANAAAEKASAKQAEKDAGKPADKVSGKSAEKASAKPAKKNAGKSAEKASGKSSEKASGKSAEKDAAKPADKDAGKSVEKDAGKQVDKVSGKSAEKDAGKSSEKASAKPDEKDAGKPVDKASGKSAEKDVSELKASPETAEPKAAKKRDQVNQVLEEGGVKLKQQQLSAVMNALNSTHKKHDFYIHIIRSQGQQQGLALYRRIGSFYGKLSTIVH